MPPVTSPMPASTMSQEQFIAELKSIQKSISDQAMNYTKLVLGLGYAGFFTAWAGTKTQLGPIERVGSAFLICLSLLAYIGFEIVQGWFLNNASIELARTIGRSGSETSALNEYKLRVAKTQEPLLRNWKWVYYFSAG